MKVAKVELYNATSSKVFTFGEDGWKLYNEIEGLNTLTPNLNLVQNASSFGSTLTGASIGNRILTLHAVNTKSSDVSQIRNNILASIKPGVSEYTLKIYYDDKVRELHKCYITDYNVFSGNLNKFVKADFTFTALDPFYYAENYKELFSNGSEIAGAVNEGSAPALPVIETTGAISDIVTIYCGLAYGSGNITIRYPDFLLDTKPDHLIIDLEHDIFNDYRGLSFSRDYKHIFIHPGTTAVLEGEGNINIKIKERYYNI